MLLSEQLPQSNSFGLSIEQGVYPAQDMIQKLEQSALAGYVLHGQNMLVRCAVHSQNMSTIRPEPTGEPFTMTLHGRVTIGTEGDHSLGHVQSQDGRYLLKALQDAFSIFTQQSNAT